MALANRVFSGKSRLSRMRHRSCCNAGEEALESDAERAVDLSWLGPIVCIRLCPFHELVSALRCPALICLPAQPGVHPRFTPEWVEQNLGGSYKRTKL